MLKFSFSFFGFLFLWYNVHSIKINNAAYLYDPHSVSGADLLWNIMHYGEIFGESSHKNMVMRFIRGMYPGGPYQGISPKPTPNQLKHLQDIAGGRAMANYFTGLQLLSKCNSVVGRFQEGKCVLKYACDHRGITKIWDEREGNFHSTRWNGDDGLMCEWAHAFGLDTYGPADAFFWMGLCQQYATVEFLDEWMASDSEEFMKYHRMRLQDSGC